MGLTKAGLVQPQGLSTTERDLLVLAGADLGRLIYNETTQHLQQWDGTQWVDVLNTASSLNAAKLVGVVSGALIDTLPASKVTGQMTDAQLAALSTSKLTGVIVDAQVASLDAAKLTGQIVDAQVASLSTSKLTGQIVDAQVVSLDAAKLTGVIDCGSY